MSRRVLFRLALRAWPLLSLLCAAGVFAQSSQVAGTPVPTPLRGSRYLSGPTLNLAALLPDPPAPGTSAAEADLAAVHAAEVSRTSLQVKEAQRDDHEESIFAFATVLGAGFNPAELPLTAGLSVHVRAESGTVNPAMKLLFQRPRPFVADRTLHPVCDRTTSNSYPSGHAMVGYLEAFTLAQMIPEQRTAILARAREYAQNRVVCGVHYPTDIEASHTAALALFGELSTSARFQEELSAARAELRGHLGLKPAGANSSTQAAR